MTANPQTIAKWLGLLVMVCACAGGSNDGSSPNIRRSVAVLDYENLSPMNTLQVDLSELLTAKAIETIHSAGQHDVVERQRLSMVLEELNLGTSLVADRRTQLQLGKITGAHLMVFGSYQIIADKLRLDVRLVDVESGRVINAVSHVADEHSLTGWLDASATAIRALFRY